MDYIIEYVDRGGSNWSRYSRDSNESQAIRTAQSLAASRTGSRVRVIDSSGNVRFLL